MPTGLFITLEGIEGSGKSVQSRLIADELTRRSIAFVATQEPGGTAFGREIREVLLRKDGSAREPMAELLLYLADRHQHLKEVVEPALSRNRVVLSDRYHDATLAYQAIARGIGLERVQRLAEILRIRTPDLTLVYDVEVEVGLNRAQERNRKERTDHLGRFEAEELGFHRKVRDAYRQLARLYPERIVLIDGRGSPGEVFARTSPHLEKRLRGIF